MTDPDRILSEFIDAWRAGERPDAGAYVDRAPPGARPELARTIEVFLTLAPEPEYDAAAWATLTADPAVARITAAVESDDAESWSALLPRLRERRGLSLDALAGACRSGSAWPAAGRRRRARTSRTSSATGSCPSGCPDGCSTRSPPCSARPRPGWSAPAPPPSPPPERSTGARARERWSSASR